jgi:hypothetical protein
LKACPKFIAEDIDFESHKIIKFKIESVNGKKPIFPRFEYYCLKEKNSSVQAFNVFKKYFENSGKAIIDLRDKIFFVDDFDINENNVFYYIVNVDQGQHLNLQKANLKMLNKWVEIKDKNPDITFIFVCDTIKMVDGALFQLFSDLEMTFYLRLFTA